MYELKKSGGEAFQFSYEGKTYEIPSRTSLSMAKFRKIRKAIAESKNPEETAFDEVMEIFDEYAPDVMGTIDLGQAMSLFKAYANGGEEPSLGES